MTLVVPGENEHSTLFLGSTGSIVLSNTSLSAILKHAEVEILQVSEPQIEGVSDEDITDDSKPVNFEEIKDENDVDRDVDKVVEGTEDLTAE